MYGLNEFNNNNNNNANWSNGLPSNYLNYIEMINSSNNNNNSLTTAAQDYLNSSGNEKNFLNSSLNLPIEQRYNSLNEMVAKIIEDEAHKNFLANSTKQFDTLKKK
jgi:hypothetical protein